MSDQDNLGLRPCPRCMRQWIPMTGTICSDCEEREAKDPTPPSTAKEATELFDSGKKFNPEDI